MKQVKRAFALLMCVATVLSLCMAYASADNVCKEITGTGKPKESVTFTVTTNSNWGKNDLTIKQTKGTAYKSTDVEETYDAYGLYEVTYKNSDGKSKSKSFTGEKVTLDLKPNQTYTVTVAARGADLYWGPNCYNVHYAFKGGFFGWKTVPVWTVSAQKNVTLCQ